MGERLVVEIRRNQAAIASVYYHWSAYTIPAIEIIKSMSTVFLHNHSTFTDNELQLEIIRFAEHTTALGYFKDVRDAKKEFCKKFNIQDGQIPDDLLNVYELLFKSNGGISGDDRKYVESKFPNETFVCENVSRNDGIVSLSEEEIENTLNCAQSVIQIDLDDEKVLFGVFNEFSKQEYLMETEDVEDEYFVEIEDIPICPVDPLEFCLTDIDFLADFYCNSEKHLIRHDEKIYQFITG